MSTTAPDTSSSSEDTSYSDSEFAVSLVINVVLFAVFLTLFLIFRKRVPAVYQPRCGDAATRNTPVDNKLSEERDGIQELPTSPLSASILMRPPPPPLTTFGWVKSTIQYSDDALLATHGMDAMMYVKFLKMMLMIVGCFSVFGIVLLFPINATGENTKLSRTDKLYVDGINRLSLAGIEIGSARLIAHLLSVIFNTAVTFFFVYRLFSTYMRYRIQQKAAERTENYVVMVREVPIKGKSEEALKAYFDKLYPGKVVAVIRARNTPKLVHKQQRRDENLRKVERSWAIFNQTQERPVNKDKFLVGNKVDSIDWFTNLYNKYSEQLTTLQQQDWPATEVIFVVFSTLPASMQCAQSIIHPQNKFITAPAPAPKDILWENLYINHYHRLVRTIVVNAFMFGLIFFWAIPVTFVSGISNLDTLAKTSPFSWLKPLLDAPNIVIGFIQGFLPTLAIKIFFAILVPLIQFVSKSQGIYTLPWLSRSVMNKYYAFQLFNIFLVYSIAGSILKIVDNIAETSASTVIDLLATSIPKQYTFFINYLMILSLSGHTMALWRPGPLIVRWIKHKFLCKTEREFRDSENPGGFNYGVSYATHLLVIAIIMTYSTLAPFILIFGMIYFGLAYISQKYNIVYVHNTEYTGGGQHWVHAFHRICFGLVLYQIIFIGEFAIYDFFAGTVISAICLACTIVFWRHTYNEFARSSEFGALDVLVDTTDSYEFNTVEIRDDEFSPEGIVEAYTQPSLKKPVDEPQISGNVSARNIPVKSAAPADEHDEEVGAEMEKIEGNKK